MRRGRTCRFFDRSALAPVPAAAASPPAAHAIRFGSRRRFFRAGYRLLNLAADGYRGFERRRVFLERQSRLGCRHRWRSQCEFTRRRSRFRGGFSWRASQPDRRFLCLGFPIGPPEAFCSRGIPLRGISVLSRRLEMFRQFERHHRVARFLVKIRKLSGRIFACACAANPGGNLFPVSHILLTGIVTAEHGIGQHCPIRVVGQSPITAFIRSRSPYSL
jgi:hypothetical protein